MTKIKSIFECNNCNYQPPKWVGCCPECKNWNCISEKAPSIKTAYAKASPIKMVDIKLHESTPSKRMLSKCQEWDRVLGGGVVPGSLSILTGDPGIGKSTLLLQIANQLSWQYELFYFSSEESLSQVSQRAQRIIGKSNKILFSDENGLENIIATIENDRPQIVIIDSIQNCYLEGTQSSPGSISQLREAGFQLMQLAKTKNIAIVVTAHITKEGQMAGPKTLEHMVDTVLYLKGEDRWNLRVLRAVKNRFGPINELGFFEMQQTGLNEVSNINQHLINDISTAPGAALISYLEGSRPLLLELQALVVPTKLNMPQRVITGIDHKHVVLIAAILEKYLKIKFSACDLFFKVSGTLKVKSNTADLGIALALLSSYFQQSLPEKSIALGELSLTGQIKPINLINTHLKEATKFGVKQVIIPAMSTKIKLETTAQTAVVKNVYDLLSLFEAKN